MKKLLLLSLLCLGMATTSVEARRGHRRHRRHRGSEWIAPALFSFGAIAAASSNAHDYRSAMSENASLRRENIRLRNRIERLERKRGRLF